jgi:spore photoproduct lyase
MTDLPAFEPQLNAIGPVVERFAREADRYLMLFTKSDNVDFLCDVEHKGQTIISWSITCDAVSRLVDKGTATMQQRIAAMSRMQAKGYHVRARLSPIVPIADWRQAYTELLEALLTQVRPDLITMELLGWMDVDDLLAMFDRSLLDATAVEAAEQARDELAGVMWGPFTQRAHEEVYSFCIDTVRRLSPQTPASVCHGTTATWRALGERMRMSPESYICNCGPYSAPGGVCYDRQHAIG